MIKYSDNPNAGGKIVETVTGKMEYKINCRKIKGLYHVLGEDCHFVDNTWYRVSSGMIVFNHTKGDWVLKGKAANLVEGVVGFENNEFKKGYFEKNPCLNVIVKDANNPQSVPLLVLNEKILPETCVEYISTGEYYHNLSPDARMQAKKIRNAVDNKQKGYNIEDNVDEFADKVKRFNEFNFPISRGVSKYSKLLGDISFGFEMECIRGYLPEHLQYQTGTVVCRDGSLHDADGSQGPEFTTIPMKGAKGVQAIINLCRALSTRTNIDKNCSMHVHIGNIPTSRMFLVSLYKLGLMIQDEMFALQPYYKNDERNYAGKDKNYCQKLQPLQVNNARCLEKDYYKQYVNDGYYRIFNFLGGGKSFPSSQCNRTNKNHPRQHKWERNSRYYWLNLMNTIFSNRNTVEFRLHNGTTNAQKTITWLFICNAIVKVAASKAGAILSGKKFTLNDVLDYYNNLKSDSGREMYEYLTGYVAERKAYFLKDFNRKDYMSLNELAEDFKFRIDINEVSQMF